ncbi:MAG: imidazole glycerol phosphate synthase subunit HisH [Tractidigestivibacter sp.]|jgi:glutamine amidotransferase|uniref:imidazole glycerol phosphate synthase subunit HisH n=1 Tax=Tractidigestivibacter sp. TaxID=2847320 RepID=UPI003D8F16B1
MAGKIVVIDYHRGNLLSVVHGLSAAGASATISDDPAEIASADGLVLPGVGSFEDAMAYMDESGQSDAIRDSIARGVPFLGICLGLQLLYTRGDERSGEHGAPVQNETPVAAGTPGNDRWVAGLGILEGSCSRLRSGRLKVPHVGWDQVFATKTGHKSRILRGVPVGSNFYFTHSYAVGDDIDSSIVTGLTHYARSFPSAVEKGNVFGVQFHPEKSSSTGQIVMGNFVDVVRSGGIK